MISRLKLSESANSLPPFDDKNGSSDNIVTSDGSKNNLWKRFSRKFTRKNLYKRLPVLTWLPKYNSSAALGDLIAGITVALTVIPQSLASANIAGLPPQNGLFGSFLGCFVYIVLGGCRAVPAGPTAISSLLTWQIAGGNLEKAISLTFLSGLVMFLMGVFGLGFLIDFISGPVYSGFTSAVSLMIVTALVKDLFAISVTGTTFLQQWISFFRNIHNTSLWDPILGFGSIAILLMLRRIGMIQLGKDAKNGPSTAQKAITKALWLISTCRNAIIVLVGGVLGYLYIDENGNSPFKLMGPIPSGVPSPQLPPFGYVRDDNTTVGFMGLVAELGSGFIVLPIIVILEDIAICKAFSDGRPVDAAQEMIAIGSCNIANSFMSSFPGGGSLARSVVASSSGTRTPFNGFYTGVIVILALQFFAEYFAYIPKATLAAVIISAIIFMVEYQVIKPMWRARKLDVVLGIGTFVLCLTLRLEIGMLVAVVINLVVILYHAARPKVYVDTLKTKNGIDYLMLMPDRSLMFPSVEYTRKLVNKESGRTTLPVVVDCTHIYSADYTAAEAVQKLTQDFHSREQLLLFFNVKPSVATLFEAVVDPDRLKIFYTDEDLDRILASK